MELLVMISACKSGSARTITGASPPPHHTRVPQRLTSDEAVMPYFPYSRHSKKKSHRGSITARMVANLLKVAGVDHVITLDLHASQMQGFFSCPVDNLMAEPLIAHWIKTHVENWQKAVVVSKNPGGTKRVTSLADALKLSFGIVMTDRKRPGHRSGKESMSTSIIMERPPVHHFNGADAMDAWREPGRSRAVSQLSQPDHPPQANGHKSSPAVSESNGAGASLRGGGGGQSSSNSTPSRYRAPIPPSPLRQQHEQEPAVGNYGPSRTLAPTVENQFSDDEQDDEDEDDEEDDSKSQRARDVVTGRLVRGHIVDDDDDDDDDNEINDLPGSPNSVISGAAQINPFFTHGTPDKSSDHEYSTAADPMTASMMSTTSSFRAANGHEGMGGSGDPGSSDDEEEHLRNAEAHITLVGNVRDKPVLLVDDMIDKAGSWIAAAETVVKRGGATRVYCFATHGLFGAGCLAELEGCHYIDEIIVTNSFPVPPNASSLTRKLRVLDVSALLAEAIRRNHHGESISQLFMHYD